MKGDEMFIVYVTGASALAVMGLLGALILRVLKGIDSKEAESLNKKITKL